MRENETRRCSDMKNRKIVVIRKTGKIILSSIQKQLAISYDMRFERQNNTKRQTVTALLNKKPNKKYSDL